MKLTTALLTMNDADLLAQSIRESSATLSSYLAFAKDTYSFEDAKNYIGKTEEENKSGKGHHFAVRGTESKKIIGVVSLRKKQDPQGNDVPWYDIGYWCHIDYTGKGYTTQAVCQVVEWSIYTLKPLRLSASVNPLNTGSIRVLEKAGFTLEARLRNSRINLTSGEVLDTLIYAIIR